MDTQAINLDVLVMLADVLYSTWRALNGSQPSLCRCVPTGPRDMENVLRAWGLPGGRVQDI